MDIAMVLEDMGSQELSKEYFQKAEINADIHLKQKIYRNLTNFYLSQDSLEQARHYLELCLKTSEECDLLSGYNQALNNLTTANVMHAEKNLRAIDYYRLSLSQLVHIFNENHRDVALVRSLIGNYFLEQGRPDSALYYYQLCLISGSETFSNPDFDANPGCYEFRKDPFFIQLPASKAMAQEMLYKTTGREAYLLSALESHDLSICLFEQYSKRFRVENAKMNFRGDYIEIYQNAFNAYIEAYLHFGDDHMMHRAFEISEKSRAAILLAEMKDENARRTGLIPDSLLQKEKSIRNYLYLYQSKVKDEEVASNPEKDKLEILRSLQLEYETKYDQLIRIYEEQYPEYYRLRFSPEVVSPQKLQKLLEADEVFIEYCMNGRHLDIFTIDRHEIHVVRQECDSSLAQKISSLRNNLKFNKVREYRYEDFMKYQFTAFELYQQLIEPVKDYISGKHLIIVPDKDLSYLSFEALISKITLADTITFKSLAYLIRDYTFHYASSASIFALSGSHQKPAKKSRVLAVAPTYDLKWENIPGLDKVLEMYPPVKQDLPGALEEADRIMAVMSGTKLTGNRATEHNFRKLAEDYDILHFSLHTRVDNKNPLSSKMSFHPRGDSVDDGFLHTYEIYNLNLKGHLAVLSACGTGNGRVQEGEGVLSLARAFSFAGIHDIILTLWDIEDITSCYVVPGFYHYFLAGFDKGEALRQSKMLYISRARNEIEAHPVFWAGHTLYCNHECTHINYMPILWKLLFVSGVLMIVLSVIVYIKYQEFKNQTKKSSVDLPAKFRN
jgi:CHAT domain-containing protein